MKKWFYILLIIFSFSNMALGQQFRNIGIIGGLNHSYSTFEKSFDSNIEEYKPKIGLIAGFYGNINLSNHIDLKLDLLFIQKGDSYELKAFESQPQEKLWAKKTLNYLSFTPSLKLFSKTESYMPYVLLGPSLNIKLYGNSKFNGTFDKTNSINITEDLNTFTFDLLLGVGLEFGSLGMISEIRYYHGLSDIAENFSNFKTRTIAILIGKNL